MGYWDGEYWNGSYWGGTYWTGSYWSGMGSGGVSAPTNSVAPVISGNTIVGQTLSTTDGTWDGSPSFTYQWKRGGVEIGSATNNTYALVMADSGTAITCVVTGTNGGGSASATSNTLNIFSPIDLTPALWLAASDLTTLWQEIAGSSQVTTNGQTVGKWDDKSGAAFHLTAVADDTSRPTYGTGSGLHWVAGDGTNDILRKTAALGMYAAGACSMFFAMRGNPGAGVQMFGERNSAGANALYLAFSVTPDADDAILLIRNDAGTITSPGGGLSPTDLANEVFDDTDFVLGITDDGSTIRYYDDSATEVDNGTYTRSGVLTLNRTSLFASFNSDTPSSFFNCRIYEMVVVNRVITAGERASLITYLGYRVGLTL